MAGLLDIPPWLQITPSFFTNALVAGAHAGLAVADQNARAQQLAEARAERQARAQERADAEAERTRQFEESRLLDVQKIAQSAQALKQKQDYENTRESRLFNYELGRLGIEQARADTADKRQAAQDKATNLRLDFMKTGLDLREKHDNEIAEHNKQVLQLQQEKAAKEKAPTVTKNVYDPSNPFVAIGSIRGTPEQVGMPGEDEVLPLPPNVKQADLIKGKKYRLPNFGDMTWDGDNFTSE